MSDGNPFGSLAPQFPSGLLPAEVAALLGIQPDGAQPGPVQGQSGPSVGALLFDRAGMGGGLNPFASRNAGAGVPNVPVAMTEADTQRLERGMMPPDGPAPRDVPLPPMRPSAADLMVPQPAATGSISGLNPGGGGATPRAGIGQPPAQGPQAPAAAPGDPTVMRPVDSFDPLTGQVTSGAPQRLGTPPGAPAHAGAAQPTATAPGQAGMPDMFGKFLTGLQNPEVSNLLLNLGIGLMSQRGIGQGLAAGLKGYQEAGNNLTRQQLQNFQLQQQIAGQQAVRGALAGKGLSREMIEAAALNPAVLSSVLAQQNKDPSQITYGGNTYLVPPGGRPGPDNMLGPSNGPQAGFEADPANPGAQRPIAGGSADPTYLQRKAEATASSKPQYVKMKDEQGVEHVFLSDPDTGALSRPPGLPESGPSGNPYATGKFNSDQAKAAGFSDRMLGSEPTLRRFEGLNSGNALGATIAGMAPNAMKSTERQQMDQAQRDFINAQLRRESGAAISQGEFDNARSQYFPQPGDASEVIAQKRRNRQTAIEAMAREGGSAYRPKSVFDERGDIVPFGESRSASTPAQPSRAQLEAEARRRGLIK